MLQRFLLFCICLHCCFNTNAQSSNKELESSIEALNKATIAQDKQALENLAEKDLTYGHSPKLKIPNRPSVSWVNSRLFVISVR